MDASGLEWTEFLDLAQVTNHQADLGATTERFFIADVWPALALHRLLQNHPQHKGLVL